MKKMITLVCIALCTTATYCQITYDNSCTEKVPLSFTNDKRAQEAFEEHGKPGLNYLNLLLNENGLKYMGSDLDEVEDLENVFEKPKKKSGSNTFDVVIGLERGAPMDYFKRLICTLKKLGPGNIDSINVYFYDSN
ncbi:hypothetical protein [Flagellimonas eckloniae]|uniref:Uncharacterized protein n=1 Tax=Flagellimonas eckloniae TaxID=346185 RepID=A0A0Q0XJM5_9FLAO|nr:hypothetical protein [Allomuricauda eckloniae]KQC31110.1 hypothetical protein AAY42_15335 [Allomuricauda eckloniae]